jgi:hypothetical protein
VVFYNHNIISIIAPNKSKYVLLPTKYQLMSLTEKNNQESSESQCISVVKDNRVGLMKMF